MPQRKSHHWELSEAGVSHMEKEQERSLFFPCQNETLKTEEILHLGDEVNAWS